MRILGTHGVPAAYGGFETAAENLSRHLVDHGWRVVVYCQIDGHGPVVTDTWQGVERVLIPVTHGGWRGSGTFDLISIRHASKHRDLCLTFGYNTAFLNVLQRARGIPNIINMDGIEWQREKWGPVHKSILRTGERIAGRIGTHLIADHPEIARHLRRRVSADRISTIAYGAPEVTSASAEPVRKLGLTPGHYLTVVCRPTPENSVVDIVRAFSRRPRGSKLVVVGGYDPSDDYQGSVLSAAGDDVVFPGSIYEPAAIQSLRFHSLAYVHGHTVGGTNPSLVEAMGAGNPVIAHDNPYNRWVAGAGGAYFRSEDELAGIFDSLAEQPQRLAEMSEASRARFRAEFNWERVAGMYRNLLERYVPENCTREPDRTAMSSQSKEYRDFGRSGRREEEGVRR
ncbi:MAG: DUF1972 domain-containing protein [Mycobacteriales bacterium]